MISNTCRFIRHNSAGFVVTSFLSFIGGGIFKYCQSHDLQHGDVRLDRLETATRGP